MPGWASSRHSPSLHRPRGWSGLLRRTGWSPNWWPGPTPVTRPAWSQPGLSGRCRLTLPLGPPRYGPLAHQAGWWMPAPVAPSRRRDTLVVCFTPMSYHQVASRPQARFCRRSSGRRPRRNRTRENASRERPARRYTKAPGSVVNAPSNAGLRTLLRSAPTPPREGRRTDSGHGGGPAAEVVNLGQKVHSAGTGRAIQHHFLP